MTSIQTMLPIAFEVPSRPFTVWTDDPVRIEGDRLGDPGTERTALILAHGLMGWHRKPRFARFAELLSERRFTVYAMDLRGHGRSGGVCDYGGREVLDVDAVVRLARSVGHPHVVTVGTSMGAIAVLRHAGLVGGVDAVVGISSLAYWDWRADAHPRVRQSIRRATSTRGGRVALRAWGVRLPGSWEAPESPEDVVGGISPSPVVIVHGRDDHLFPEEHAMRLYEAAKEPKRLLLGDRFGHAEDGLTGSFAARLERVIEEVLAA